LLAIAPDTAGQLDPWQFVPGLVVAIVLGALVGPSAGRRAGLGSAWGIVTTISLFVILATTLSPSGGVPDSGLIPGTCVVSRIGPAGLDDLVTINEVTLNILLFVPLGAALAWMPRSRAKALAVTGAVALPFAIESIQLLVIPLGRYCDSADIADNLTGLAIGLGLGALAGVVWRHRHRTLPAPGRSNERP
jgi:hypothetical protein